METTVEEPDAFTRDQLKAAREFWECGWDELTPVQRGDLAAKHGVITEADRTPDRQETYELGKLIIMRAIEKDKYFAMMDEAREMVFKPLFQPAIDHLVDQGMIEVTYDKYTGREMIGLTPLSKGESLF